MKFYQFSPLGSYQWISKTKLFSDFDIFYIPSTVKHRIIMRMNIILLVMISTFLQVSATSYAQKITLTENNASIVDIFKEIQDQSGYDFIYSHRLINKAERINIHVKDATLLEVLEKCFEEQPFTYLIKDKTIVIKEKEHSAQHKTSITSTTKPPIDITGTVTDENGEPIPGVSITLKGTSLGTVTDTEGRYILSVPNAQGALVFSFVGFASREIPIENNEILDVTLKEEISSLNEVVVVGYGTVKKSSLTSSISKIENKKLDQLPELRVENALSGRMAGVYIANDRNRPGEAPKIRVRGIGSISAGNEPLVVIDGFPGGDLSQLSMNDVESIEVLKDASAAAIYGSRGGGGVILVSTKRGTSGKANLKLSSYFGYAKAMVHDDWMVGEEWYDYIVKYQNREFTWAGGDASIPAWGDDRRPSTYQSDPSVINMPQTVWQDEVLQVAPIQNHNFSVSGGNQNVKYYVSGTYANEKGVVKTASYKQYLLRANLDVKVNDFIDLGFELSPSYTKRRIAGQDMVNLVKYPAFVSPIPVNGKYVESPTGYAGIGNPYVYLYGTENFENRFRNIGRAFVNLELLEGLNFKSSIGTNISFSTADYFRGNLGSTDRITTAGSAGDVQSFDLVNENVLSYTKTLNEVHDIGGILGASYQNANSRSTAIGAIANSFNNEIIKTLNNALINPSATTQSKTEWGLISYFARVNYGYKNKYLLSASFRTDGSSRFGAANKWGYFPSASVAWRVSEEAFMQDIPVISDLKLRASYGVTGNFNIGNFQYLGTVANVNYSPGNETIDGFAQTSLENEGLSWEKTTANDLGVELGLFKNRLHIIFDYYDSRTTNMLYNVNTPAISGFNNTITNIGEVRNKGIEFEISTQNLVGEFKWNTSFNLSHNKNEVVDLGEVDERINSYWSMDFILREGEPMFSYYGYKMNGVFQNQAQIENSATLPDTKPGNPIMVDQNKDGKITPDDKVILGSFQPDLLLGMTNEFSWKRFDLNVFLQASLGAEILNFENQYYQGNTQGAMRRSLAENQWWSEAEPGDGKTPAAALSQLFGHNTFTDYYIEDASFLSIRSLNLGYTLPEFAQKLGVSNLRIYTSMNNLLLIKNKNNHSYNPEGTTRGEISGINSTPGVNLGSEPINRTIVFGINFGF